MLSHAGHGYIMRISIESECAPALTSIIGSYFSLPSSMRAELKFAKVVRVRHFFDYNEEIVPRLRGGLWMVPSRLGHPWKVSVGQFSRAPKRFQEVDPTQVRSRELGRGSDNSVYAQAAGVIR